MWNRWIEVNLDGTFDTRTGQAGINAIVRDDKGQVVSFRTLLGW
jgi:hypothetical protein